MSEYLLSGIDKANEGELKKGTYIILTYATSIPPHLSVMIDGKIYSITVRGPKLDLPLEVQLKLIKTKKIRTVFIKLQGSILVQNDQLFVKARAHTLLFKKVEIGIITCLSPIKSFCAEVFGIEVNEVNFIFDLIPVLKQNGLIDGFSHLNMEPFIFKGEYSIYKYSLSDIYENIYQLELENNVC